MKKQIEKWKIYDWAGNDIGSPIFDHIDDASDWLCCLIDKVYGTDLSEEEYDQQRDEYVFHDVTSDEDKIIIA